MTSYEVLLHTNNFRSHWESTHFKEIFSLISTVPAWRQGGSGDLPANREQRQGVVRNSRRVPRDRRRLQEVVEGEELARPRRPRASYHRVPLRRRAAEAELWACPASQASAELVAADDRLASAGGEGWPSWGI